MLTNRLLCIVFAQLFSLHCYNATLPMLLSSRPSVMGLRTQAPSSTIISHSGALLADPDTDYASLTTDLMICSNERDCLNTLKMAFTKHQREALASVRHPADIVDENGQNALMVLIDRGFIRAIQYLLEDNFARIFGKTPNGSTMLFYSLDRRQYDVFVFLLRLITQHIQNPATKNGPTIIAQSILSYHTEDAIDLLGLAAQSGGEVGAHRCFEALCDFYLLIPASMHQTLVLAHNKPIRLTALLMRSRKAALAFVLEHANQPAFTILAKQPWPSPFRTIVCDICTGLTDLGTYTGPNIQEWLAELEH